MYRILTLTAAFTFALDQVTKLAVVHGMDLINQKFIVVLDGFLYFIMAWNRGINFGLFAGSDQVTRYVLIAIALVISVVVAVWMRKEPNPKAMFSAGLLIGGAIGNVFDRVIYGAVADFLNVTCCGIRNPYSFNVADITIFLGAIGLIFFATDRKNT